MELVIIEMNECFVVEIFSEALGSEAVFFWDFLVVYRELRRYERSLSLSVSLYTVENLITTLHYSPEVGTIHSPRKK